MTAIPATRAHRSGSATYRGSASGSSGSISLNENGAVMIRPSNSGIATWLAESSGLTPSSDASHSARLLVRQSPCSTGMSRAAIRSTSQVSSSPPALASAGTVPPAASTVTISASRVPSASNRSSGAARSEPAKIGTATAWPVASTASARACTKSVFPLTWCAR